MDGVAKEQQQSMVYNNMINSSSSYVHSVLSYELIIREEVSLHQTDNYFVKQAGTEMSTIAVT